MSPPKEELDAIARELARDIGLELNRLDYSHTRLTAFVAPFLQRAFELRSSAVLSERDAVRRERELIEAKREGFEAGIYAAHCSYWACSEKVKETPLYEWREGEYRPFLRGAEVERVVKQKYPLPSPPRLCARFSNGTVWSYEPDVDPVFAFRKHVDSPANDDRDRYRFAAISNCVQTPEDVTALAGILSLSHEDKAAT